MDANLSILSNAILNESNFSHQCNSSSHLDSCVRQVLNPYLEQLTGKPDVEVLLNRLAIMVTDSVDSPISSPVSEGDQCNVTSECKSTFGDRATDCANSGSAQSICMCG